MTPEARSYLDKARIAANDAPTPAGETVDKSAVTRIKAEAAARFRKGGGKRQAGAA